MRLSFPEGLWQTWPAVFGCDEPLDTPEGVPDYMVNQDFARAQEFWAQSGYNDQPIVVLSYNETQQTINQGLALKEDLEALGANVDLVSADGGTFFGRIFNSAPPDEGGWNIYGLWLTLATSPSFHGCLRTDQFGWELRCSPNGRPQIGISLGRDCLREETPRRGDAAPILRRSDVCGFRGGENLQGLSQLCERRTYRCSRHNGHLLEHLAR